MKIKELTELAKRAEKILKKGNFEGNMEELIITISYLYRNPMVMDHEWPNIIQKLSKILDLQTNMAVALTEDIDEILKLADMSQAVFDGQLTLEEAEEKLTNEAIQKPHN